MHRKLVIRLLNRPLDASKAKGTARHIYGKTIYSVTTLKIIEQIWQTLGYP